MPDGRCRHCGERYGGHSVSCPVKFRDVMGVPPAAQELHEQGDVAYEAIDDAKAAEAAGEESHGQV